MHWLLLEWLQDVDGTDSTLSVLSEGDHSLLEEDWFEEEAQEVRCPLRHLLTDAPHRPHMQTRPWVREKRRMHRTLSWPFGSEFAGHTQLEWSGAGGGG